ncbi:hypothetical protein PICMEDRAFT_74173 [Pichia membranifaciens NRRL Y-2026]|uniref:Nop domain-containing protein n=1 Tax=Pichia membranifaciens NRRL Y-2026 TaxID=763406 RepID=A0A1E3NH12_9ASCO|nr:hypothetical protein PICMEDRAFT_74173 [Pichia membranifaciens NRRL Y-2026]ODQ45414.1 hypothetical protein PICMEDRAFT_74173 [Pichia membranifaciens NRRL Y-2026]
MSLADTLLGDLSEDDFDVEVGEDVDIDDIEEANSGVERNVQELLTVSNMDIISSVEEYVSILPKLKFLEEKLDREEGSGGGQAIISETNSMIAEINSNFNTLLSFVKLTYNSVWPDLENIIKNPLYFIRVIEILRFDISSFKEHAEDEAFSFLPKDLILSLTMSVNFLLKSKQSRVPSEHVQGLVLEACRVMTYINELQLKFRAFITTRVQNIAPNITALVGTTVAAQLIATAGLESLCTIPACNIPSLGKSVNRSALGYVYQSDPVKNVSDDFKKQAVRQVCAKISLSARIDRSVSQTGTSNGTHGARWRDEIEKRLEKMMSPPDNVQIKPLPKPVDMKSKRRGGRKFKKMRQRMKMSEVEKAQNKMAFGEQELTKIDAFGEEVGLGMLGKTSIRDIEGVRGVHVTQGARKAVDKFTSGGAHGNAGDDTDKLVAILDTK